jgi:hypothetical protein
MLFPGKRIDGKMTINGARGFHPKIKDRFDLTVECIRRHYRAEDSPLSDTLSRYADFFALFRNFEGYVEHFLLQDLFTADCFGGAWRAPPTSEDGSGRHHICGPAFPHGMTTIGLGSTTLVNVVEPCARLAGASVGAINRASRRRRCNKPPAPTPRPSGHNKVRQRSPK